MDGRSGSIGVRWMVVTPSARSFPLLIWGISPVMAWTVMSTSPVMTPVKAAHVPLVGHMQDMGAGLVFEKRGGEMGIGARSPGSGFQNTRFRFGQSHQFPDGCRRNRGIDHQNLRHHAQQADCSKIPGQGVLVILMHHLDDGLGSRYDQDGIAVRRPSIHAKTY